MNRNIFLALMVAILFIGCSTGVSENSDITESKFEHNEMTTENFCSSFMHHVGNGGDPHDCWQEDGFWPDKIDAPLEHIQVWGCGLAYSYCNSGDLVQFLSFTSGRLLPEMRAGLVILDCPVSAAFCQSVIDKFGPEYPRNDQARADFVASNMDEFETADREFWVALDRDDFRTKANAYYKKYCVDRGIPPWGPDYHPSSK